MSWRDAPWNSIRQVVLQDVDVIYERSWSTSNDLLLERGAVPTDYPLVI